MLFSWVVDIKSSVCVYGKHVHGYHWCIYSHLAWCTCIVYFLCLSILHAVSRNNYNNYKQWAHSARPLLAVVHLILCRVLLQYIIHVYIYTLSWIKRMVSIATPWHRPSRMLSNQWNRVVNFMSAMHADPPPITTENSSLTLLQSLSSKSRSKQKSRK